MKFKAVALCFCILWSLLLFSQTKTLNDYLQYGLANSPLLADYHNQIESTKYDSLIFRASLKPQVSLDGKILVVPGFGEFGYSKDVVTPNEPSLVGAVTQEILAGKANKIRYRQLNINSQLLNLSARLSTRELKKSIIDQYIITWNHHYRLQLADSILLLMKNFSEVLKPMVEKGIYRATDYLSFTIETQARQIQVSQLKFQYKSDLDSLNMMCGIIDTLSYELAPPEISMSFNPSLPFLLSPKFNTDSLRISVERNIIGYRYRPRLSWFADAGVNALKFNEAHKNFGASFGVSLTIPIYDGKQRNMEIKKLDLEEDTRQRYLEFYRNAYTLKTMQLRQNIILNNNLLSQYREQVKLTNALIDLTGKQFSKGEISVVDFLNAIRNYKEIHSTLNELELQQQQLINEINFLNSY